MTKDEQLSHILGTGVVAVIRASSGERLVPVAHALVEGGVDILEVTYTVPNATEVIRQVIAAVGNRAIVGAGTVLDTDTAEEAIRAGARFIVSPCINRDVIRLCRRGNIIVMPGAFTPTEVVAAWDAGADIIKIFPSDNAGPRHLKALRAPLPHIPMMPTGGVDLENAADFIRAGACALGVGGSLVKKSAVESGNTREITQLAQQFVEVVRHSRRKE
jgi:2-dehydro-3-deoxyphosphogluconate aldolase/(4S)-4-hydroxy-2-oxoglutarate aldolase